MLTMVDSKFLNDGIHFFESADNFCNISNFFKEVYKLMNFYMKEFLFFESSNISKQNFCNISNYSPRRSLSI